MLFADGEEDEYFNSINLGYIQTNLDQFNTQQADNTTPTTQMSSLSAAFYEEPAGSSTMSQSVAGHCDATFEEQDTSTSPTWEVQCAPRVLYDAMGNSQMAAQYGGLNHSHVAMQAPPPNSYRCAGPSQLHPSLSTWQNPTPSPAHWANLLGNYSPQTACHLQPNLTAQFAAPMQQSFPGAAMGQAPLATPMAPSAFAQSRYPMHLPTSQSLSSNFMGSSFGQEEAYPEVYHALNQQQTFYPPSIQQQPTGFSQGTNYGFAPVQPQFPSTPRLEPALFPGSQDFIAQPQTPPEYVPNTLESHEMGHVQMPTSSAMQVSYPPVAGPSRPAASLPSAPAPFEVTFVNYIPPVEPTTPTQVKKTLQKPAKAAKIAKATNAAKPKNSRKRDENTDKVKQSLERKKVYQCDLCSQVCSSISDLKRHKESKIHSEKKYFCKTSLEKLPYSGGAGGLTMIRRKMSEGDVL